MTDSTTAEVVVARVRQPAADESTVTSQSYDVCDRLQYDMLPSNVGTRIDEPNEPTIAHLVRVAFSLSLANAEFLECVSLRISQSIHSSTYDWETQVGAVRTSLIPSLDSSTNRADNDGEVECQRVAPAMSSFESKSFALILGEGLDLLEGRWVLCNQGSSLDQVDTLCQAFLVAKDLNIVHQIRE